MMPREIEFLKEKVNQNLHYRKHSMVSFRIKLIRAYCIFAAIFINFALVNAANMQVTNATAYFDGTVFESNTTNGQMQVSYIDIGEEGREIYENGKSTGERNFYIKDHLGSTRVVVNGANNMIEAISYQPYGTMVPLTASSESQQKVIRDKFTGKEFDAGQNPVSEVGYNITIAKFDAGRHYYGELYVNYTDLASKQSFLKAYELVYDPSAKKYSLNKSERFPDNMKITHLRIATSGAAGSIDYEKDCDYTINTDEGQTISLNVNGDALISNAGVDYFVPGSKYTPERVAGSNLYYFGARYYDPETGVWTSTDPASQFFNLYSYTGGNPANLIDANGMWSWRKFKNVLYSVINFPAYFERVSKRGGSKWSDWDPTRDYDSYFFGWGHGDKNGPVLGDPNQPAGTQQVDLNPKKNDKKEENKNIKIETKSPTDQSTQKSPGGVGTDGTTVTSSGGTIPLIPPASYINYYKLGPTGMEPVSKWVNVDDISYFNGNAYKISWEYDYIPGDPQSFLAAFAAMAIQKDGAWDDPYAQATYETFNNFARALDGISIVYGGTSSSMKKLTNGEIKMLQKRGIDVHDLKGGKNASKFDLFKDGKGDIHVKPKSGVGPGDPTGLNIDHF